MIVVKCSWCGRVIKREISSKELTTGGICGTCVLALERTLEEALKVRGAEIIEINRICR